LSLSPTRYHSVPIIGSLNQYLPSFQRPYNTNGQLQSQIFLQYCARSDRLVG
jgi:hypothetical protein